MDDPERAYLLKRIAELESENRVLRDENEALRRQVPSVSSVASMSSLVAPSPQTPSANRRTPEPSPRNEGNAVRGLGSMKVPMVSPRPPPSKLPPGTALNVPPPPSAASAAVSPGRTATAAPPVAALPRLPDVSPPLPVRKSGRDEQESRRRAQVADGSVGAGDVDDGLPPPPPPPSTDELPTLPSLPALPNVTSPQAAIRKSREIPQLDDSGRRISTTVSQELPRAAMGRGRPQDGSNTPTRLGSSSPAVVRRAGGPGSVSASPQLLHAGSGGAPLMPSLPTSIGSSGASSGAPSVASSPGVAVDEGPTVAARYRPAPPSRQPTLVDSPNKAPVEWEHGAGGSRDSIKMDPPSRSGSVGSRDSLKMEPTRSPRDSATIARSPRDSAASMTEGEAGDEERDLPTFAIEGRVISALQCRVADDAGVKSALGADNKLKLSAFGVFFQEAEKIEWFLVRAAVVSQEEPDAGASSSWVIPRTYANFVALHKSLGAGVPDLPPKANFKARATADAESATATRAAALNTWLWEVAQAQPQLMHSSLAVLRFVDPYDKPSLFGLRLLIPTHEGVMDMWKSGKTKPKEFTFVLRDDLFCFRQGVEQSRIPLENVTLEIVTGSEYGKFVFSLTNLQKETVTFGVDSSKTLTEWMLKLREAKFLRSGGVGSAAISSVGSESALALSAVVRARAAAPPESALRVKALITAHVEGQSATQDVTALTPVRVAPEKDSVENIVFVDGSVREATLNKLVEKLFDADATPSAYVSVVLTTFRYWITPTELFQRLQAAWADSGASSTVDPSPTHVRLLLVLRVWLKEHFSDLYNDEQLAGSMMQFMRVHVNAYSAFAKYSAVLQIILKEHLQVAFQTGFARNPAGAPLPILPALVSAAHIELLDLNAVEVARQLTLIEFRQYEAVQVEELQDQRWNSAEKRDALCPNVNAIIRRFNLTSLWAQTLVVRATSMEARVAIMRHLLDVCASLLELRNYNAVWEIYSGLKSSAVRRLTETWAQLPAQSMLLFDDLTALTETSSNFKNYRSRLAQCGASSPCVPYLGLYLTDLTFAEEKNPSRVGPRINYVKFATIASILADVLRFQRVRYALKPVDYLIDYFNRLEALEEDKCFALSLAIQPRKQ